LADFIDSDVLIDVLRGTPAAQTWLSALDHTIFEVPGIVAMEIVCGCRDKQELARCLKLVRSFGLIWADRAESAMAFDYLIAYWLSHSLGIADCVIAAIVKSRSAILYSFNAKHFRAIPDLDVREPYQRS
jgi:predicted nucleic acid-binding protein